MYSVWILDDKNFNDDLTMNMTCRLTKKTVKVSTDIYSEALSRKVADPRNIRYSIIGDATVVFDDPPSPDLPIEPFIVKVMKERGFL